MISHFSRLKDENISPARYLEYVENLKANTDSILSSKNKGITKSKTLKTTKSKKILPTNQLTRQNRKN